MIEAVWNCEEINSINNINIVDLINSVDALAEYMVICRRWPNLFLVQGNFCTWNELKRNKGI